MLKPIEMARSFTPPPRGGSVQDHPAALDAILCFRTPHRLRRWMGKLHLWRSLFGAQGGLRVFSCRKPRALPMPPPVFATCFAIVAIFWIGEKLIIDPLARRFTRQRIA